MPFTTPYGWVALGFLLVVYVLLKVTDAWLTKHGVPPKHNKT